MIPSKLPKGTILEQWERYEKELKAHETYYESIKPNPLRFVTIKSFNQAIDKWLMDKSMDTPNKPGSEFSNND